MDRPVVGDARFSFLASSSQRFFRSATVTKEKFELPNINQQRIAGNLGAIPRVNSIHVYKPTVPAQSERVTFPEIRRKPG